MVAEKQELTDEQRYAKGLAVARRMLANQKQAQIEAEYRYQNDPQIRKVIEKLRDKNAERGTPVI